MKPWLKTFGINLLIFLPLKLIFDLLILSKPADGTYFLSLLIISLLFAAIMTFVVKRRKQLPDTKS